MGHDDHIGVLQVGGDQVIGPRAHQLNPSDTAECSLVLGAEAGRANEGDAQIGTGGCQVQNQ